MSPSGPIKVRVVSCRTCERRVLEQPGFFMARLAFGEEQSGVAASVSLGGERPILGGRLAGLRQHACFFQTGFVSTFLAGAFAFVVCAA